MITPTLSPKEIEAITGYTQPARQIGALHERGFVRAYRDRLGRVILERPHYDAVCQGTYHRAQAAGARPAVNVSFLQRVA